MIDYRVPLDEILFTLEQVAGVRTLDNWDSEMAHEILSHGARFVDEVIAPLDPIGDKEGVKIVDGRVLVPAAFKAAYQAYCEGGWPALAADPRYGGEGQSDILVAAFAEMLSGACISFHMNVSLGQGVMRTLRANASEAMKAQWIPRLCSGEWLATMCLSEPQAGSDLALIRTVATPKDGAWTLRGGKIFISGGDQNLNGRVVHLVLARTEGAQAGLKGLSLFLVPSELENGERNNISVLRVEEKMGLHASPTCQLAFDDAVGEMIGGPGEGLMRMFTLMNVQRLDVALQGVAVASCAAQRSAAYATSRKQGRRPNSAEPALIAEHNDVVRMLMTQMALAIGGRAMCYRALADIERFGNTPLAELMTSVCKAFCTDGAVEAANLAIQIHGGYGFLAEYRVEQLLRDVRVTQIFEGTNGIHAMTLAGRLIRNEAVVKAFADEIGSVIEALRGADCEESAAALATTLGSWTAAAKAVAATPDVGAKAYAFLQLTGLVAFGAAWGRLEMAAASAPQPKKIFALARFVRDFMLPARSSLEAACVSSATYEGFSEIIRNG